MMQEKEQSKPPTDKNDRRRGRPAGKNRAPLSLEERRARNAQYERERRNETAEAMAQLAEAACCDPQITNPELLATVISRLQQADKEPLETIEDLKRINDNLESQIADLQSRLKCDSNNKKVNTDETIHGIKLSKFDSGSESSRDHRPIKYRKTEKNSTVHNVKVRKNSSQSSADSDDSDWSHHYLGKTLPGQEPLPQYRGQSDSDKTSVHTRKISTSSSEYRPASSSENELYSDTFDQSESSGFTISQREVKVEFQLVPQEDGVEANDEHSSELGFRNPFTESEKGLQDRQGFRDFMCFENDDEEAREETKLSWPLDFDDFLSGF